MFNNGRDYSCIYFHFKETEGVFLRNLDFIPRVGEAVSVLQNKNGATNDEKCEIIRGIVSGVGHAIRKELVDGHERTVQIVNVSVSPTED